MKACFATKGFHGKIDCDEWAKDTNYKSLPSKKQQGGYNMYRPKNCKKCGGKMQQGGLNYYTQSNTPQGAITSTGQSSLASNSQLTPAQIQQLAASFGFRTDSNRNLQQDLFDYAQKNQPSAYNQVMEKYGQTNAGTFVDDILGARTGDLLRSLQKPNPAPQQAALTEWLYGPDKHSLGTASQPYRDSKSASDPGILNGPEGPQYVDFMFNKPESQETDPSRGRYRIPYDVWSNQITGNTSTVKNPDLINQYRADNMAVNPIKMKGGRLQRMQNGGPMPRQQDYPDYESWQAAMDEWHNSNAQQIAPAGATMNMLQNFSQPVQEFDRPAPEPAQQPLNAVQDAISKGLIEAPKGFDSAQQWYNYMNTPAPTAKQKKKNNNPYQTLQNVGLGIQAARTGLGWISGAVERGRQNQYDMMQQTALGQMNPIQSSDFQPNPYNLYMQMGGNLKTIMKDYNYWSNNAGPMDMTDGTGNPNMKKGGFEIDRMLIVRKLLPELLNFGRGPHKYRGYQAGGIKPRYQGLVGNTPQDSLMYVNAFNRADSLAGAPYPSGWGLQNLGSAQFRGMNNALGAEMSKNDIRLKNYPTRDVINEQAAFQDFLEQQRRAILDNYLPAQSRKPLQQGGTSYKPPTPDYSFIGPPTSKDSIDYRKHFYDYLYNKNGARDSWDAAFLINQKAIPPAAYDSVQNMWSAWSDAEDDMMNAKARKDEQKQMSNAIGPTSAGAQAAQAALARLKAGLPPMKKGGIHIKPENKGKFTDYCGGKVTDECIQKGLNSPSATIRKRANFARNARSWN